MKSIPSTSLVILLSVMITTGNLYSQSIPQPRIGINLAGPADWNTELPFVDVFRMSRPWISQQQDKPWGQGPELNLDEHGWIKELQPNCWAETLINTIDGGHYPQGSYTLLYDGKGRIEALGGAQISERKNGRLILKTNSSGGSIFVRIKQTDPNDYIRNIRVIMPGFESKHEQNPWHPTFLNRWQGMASLRFMDFMYTNNSHITDWSDRPTPKDATFSAKGVALEYMIDLSNRLNAAPWFCMPHQANDEYIRNFAEMVRDQLDPDLKIYVEYSNELWNSMFAQCQYAQQQGLQRQLGHPDRPWEAGWQYTALRSVEIFRIWRDVFGGTERLIRVLPGFAANPYVSEQVTIFQDAFKHADALAIAPYISFIISPDGTPNAQTVQSWSIEQLLNTLRDKHLPESIEWMKKNKDIADKHGLKLICYEAGQHMVGSAGAENNEMLTKLLKQANAHPQLGKFYDEYYQSWIETGGDLMCHFSSVSNWSKWGSWGLIEYYDSPPTPKFTSTLRQAQKLGQKVNIPKQ